MRQWRRGLVLGLCTALLAACSSSKGLHPAKVEAPPGVNAQTPAGKPGASIKIDLEGSGHPDTVVGAVGNWGNSLQVLAQDGKVLLDLAWDQPHLARVAGISAPTPALWLTDQGTLSGYYNTVFLFDAPRNKMVPLPWVNPTPFGSAPERPNDLLAVCTGRDTLSNLTCTFTLDDLAKHSVQVIFKYDAGRLLGSRGGAALTFPQPAHDPAAPEELFKMLFTALSLRVEGEVLDYFTRPEAGRQAYATAAGIPQDQTPAVSFVLQPGNMYKVKATWAKGLTTAATAVVDSSKGKWRIASLTWG